MPDHPSPVPLTRRTVVVGAGALGAGLVVAGCATEDTGTGEAAPRTSTAGTVLGPAAEVPVGSAKIYGTQGIVVTQATGGSFAAFSTVCPHQGCAVAAVEGATIVCPCHGSRFALDGSVEQGPATSPLSSRGVSVANDQLTLS